METKIHHLDKKELLIVYRGGELSYTPEQREHLDRTIDQINNKRIKDGLKPFNNGKLFPLELPKGTSSILQEVDGNYVLNVKNGCYYDFVGTQQEEQKGNPMNLPPYRLANANALISVRDSTDPSKQKLVVGVMGKDNHFTGYQLPGGALDEKAIDKKQTLARMFVAFHRAMARRKETHGNRDLLVRYYSMYEKWLQNNRDLGQKISNLVKPQPGEQFSLEASVKSELREEIGLTRRHLKKFHLGM